MLLTIKQPAHHGYRSFHDYTPPTPPSTAHFSPVITSAGPSLPPISTATNKSLPPLPAKSNTQQLMSTPHRGLPPPAAMALPQPQQQPAPIGQPPLSQPMGQLPAPPQQWQGAEESMRNWLHAKAEEDKRKQEEEKTRQESLRLEQRKIEQDMLRTSLNGGIPPYMIPMVFAGMGGGNLPNASLEWAQHYMAQAHQQQQQIQIQQQQQQLLPSQTHTSPEQLQRRDSRVLVSQQHPVPMTLPSTPIGPPSSQQTTGFVPSNQLSPVSRSRQLAQPVSQARPAPASQLPRLNTGEMHIQAPPTGPSLPTAPGHPLQQSQTVQQQEAHSSPSIYFHHWQPPTSQSGMGNANQPTTPSDHTLSPKKRKATGPQQAAPPPTSQPQYTSPQPSQGSSVSGTPQSRRRGHSRQKSDLSARGLESYGRPNSRHHHTESYSSQGLASPPQIQGSEPGPTANSTQVRQSPAGSLSLSSMLDHGDERSRSHSHKQQQLQSSPRYSAGPEMKHNTRRASPED